MRQRLIFATGNEHKMKEIREILDESKYEIVSMKEAGVDIDIVEDGTTFEENALIKAKAVMEVTGALTLADDSGLEIDALNGEPGVRSARYAGEAHNDAKNNAKLLAELGGVPKEKRMAKFWTTIVVSMPGEFDKDLVVSGTCAGRILPLPQGEDGFGYDPLFYVPEKGKTFAQMTTDEKNEISHRGRAVEKLLQELPAWLEQFE